MIVAAFRPFSKRSCGLLLHELATIDDQTPAGTADAGGTAAAGSLTFPQPAKWQAVSINVLGPSVDNLLSRLGHGPEAATGQFHGPLILWTDVHAPT